VLAEVLDNGGDVRRAFGEEDHAGNLEEESGGGRTRCV
jgi:hypothetical protein